MTSSSTYRSAATYFARNVWQTSSWLLASLPFRIERVCQQSLNLSSAQWWQSDLLSKFTPTVEQSVDMSASRHLPAISWQFLFHLSAGLHPVFIVCTALLLSKVTVHCLLHGFLDTHLLIHSWRDIAWNRVGTIIRRCKINVNWWCGY